MILLDTPSWVWWVDDSQQLTESHKQSIQENVPSGLGVSVMSCWEIAKLVESVR